MEKNKYNKTELNVYSTIERGISHRDFWAHALRYNHVLKIAKIGMKIIDIGTGQGEMFELFYRNRYKPKRFVGLDVREQTIEKNKEKFPQAEFYAQDITEYNEKYKDDWDIITALEVFEHIRKENGPILMQNISDYANENTIILISTPCYDEKAGAAKNHIINGEVGEYAYQEFKELLEKRFRIIEHYGTFCSQRDYKDKMNEHQQWMFEKLQKYYNSNLLSNIFAPMFPEHSRNVIWKCKLKQHDTAK